jgi:uncharacterized membrane protein YciS (DUF1049 family)|tara:strand:- start:329 stop:616 length:288 start_codon:yes stop_codon:yes gene_type:complete
MTFIPKLIFIIVVLLFGLAFHVKNHQLVTLNYYIGEIQLSFSIIIVLAICVGALLGILVSIPMIIRNKQLSSRLEKEIKKREKEINNFRIMPTKD